MINRDVPPKNIANASLTPDSFATAGKIAIAARNNDPGNVMRETSESIYSAVSSPGIDHDRSVEISKHNNQDRKQHIVTQSVDIAQG
jgi:hypothetical protein